MALFCWPSIIQWQPRKQVKGPRDTTTYLPHSISHSLNFMLSCALRNLHFSEGFFMQAQLLSYCSQSDTVHSCIYSSSALIFFSGIDTTLLEIFKNLRDLSKKWMRTPEAGDHRSPHVSISQIACLLTGANKRLSLSNNDKVCWE